MDKDDAQRQNEWGGELSTVERVRNLIAVIRFKDTGNFEDHCLATQRKSDTAEWEIKSLRVGKTGPWCTLFEEQTI